MRPQEGRGRAPDDELAVLLVSPRAGGGGAELAATSLAAGLRAAGHRSWLAVGSGEDGGPALRIPRGHSRVARAALRVAGVARRRGGGIPGASGLERSLRSLAAPRRALAELRGREDFSYPGTARLLDLAPEPPDVLHAHRLNGGYFDLRRLPELSARLPLVLTLHDEWPYTGHCAYTFGLETWRTGCHHCPDLDVYPAIRRDATHANWEAKRRIYAASRLYVISPSRWLLERAQASMLAAGVADWALIPNGVDRVVFRPGDRAAARRRLGLPEDADVVLFAANRASRNPFKDIGTLLAAGRRLADGSGGRRVLVVALGDAGTPEVLPGGEVRFVPYESDRERVADFYRAADLYLHAARADNFPTVVLEALSTGTPVVATAVGGIPEQVRSLAGWPGARPPAGTGAHGPDSATGVLVAPADADGMAKAAAALLADPGLRAQMGANAEREAVERFDLEDQVRSTVAVYRRAIADWRQAREAGSG